MTKKGASQPEFILGIDVAEIYLPERVTAIAREINLTPRSAMDLSNGWDFSKVAGKLRAWKKIKEEAPYLVIGSPPCTLFSFVQEINIAQYGGDPNWMKKFEARLEQAKAHIRFCCKIYWHQLKSGKRFLHEHPWTARSWVMEELQKLRAHPEIQLIQAHMCSFGMTAPEHGKHSQDLPVKKPTGFLTSSTCIAQELEKRCNADHRHAHLMSGKAAAAQVYPQALIVRGDIERCDQAEAS